MALATKRFLKIRMIKKGEGLFVKYSVEQKNKKPKIIDEESMDEIHQDLKNAFVGLHIHWGIMSGFITTKQVKKIDAYDSELVKDIHVSGIIRGGNDDEEYIILTGYRIGEYKKASNMNTPLFRIEEDEATRYKFMDELLEVIENIEKEVNLNLGGKIAPETQQSLNFDDPEEKPKRGNKAQILPPVTPESIVGSIVNEANGKKGTGGKRKVAQSAKHPSGEAE
jgi:hypothetical protein